MIVVGIDSASKRVDAVALRDGEYFDHFTYDIDKIRPKVSWSRGGQLSAMADHTRWFLSSLDEPEGLMVFIEDSIVRMSGQTTRVLSQSVGMLLALPFPTSTVVVTEWKKYSIGKGNATKEEVQQTLAQKLGPSVTALFDGRQDLFDAAGIAIFGHSLQSKA